MWHQLRSLGSIHLWVAGMEDPEGFTTGPAPGAPHGPPLSPMVSAVQWSRPTSLCCESQTPRGKLKLPIILETGLGNPRISLLMYQLVKRVTRPAPIAPIPEEGTQLQVLVKSRVHKGRQQQLCWRPSTAPCGSTRNEAPHPRTKFPEETAPILYFKLLFAGLRVWEENTSFVLLLSLPLSQA